MRYIRIFVCILFGTFFAYGIQPQPEYRVKNISFSANTASGFQAGKPFTVTYIYENSGSATGTNVQVFAYYQIEELGLKQDLLFDAQSIPSFPAGAEATVSYTITSRTSAAFNFGGTINNAVNVGNISINIPPGPEGNIGNNTTRETVNIFCAGSILTIDDLVVTDEQPIVADEIVIGDSSILSGGKATVQGGDTVVLLNGFRANQGSDTRIQIGDCSGGNTQKLISRIKEQDIPVHMTTGDGIVRIEKISYAGATMMEAKIFPNPATNVINLTLKDKTIRIRSLKLYSNFSLIKEVKTEEAPTAKISLEGISSGFYLLEITLDNGNIITKKVMVI
ncbi:MAG: T9SS type A sorting domain-containing protein [Bacteroidota bacterium]